MSQCKVLESPDSSWSFCPSIAPAYLFAILFGLTTIAHFAQSIIYRKAYCWVIISSGLMQTTTYIFRILSILHPTNSNYYSVWFVLMLVAPLLTNAFVYMVMGRMVWNFSDDARVLHVRPWRFGLFFVILDVLAFFVQVGGAAMASGEDISHNLEKLGLHIYMAGVGAQQLFVIIFIICAIFFHRKILRQQRPDLNKALLLLYVQYVCLALITIRIIFRLCEYSQGIESSIPNHEAYQYALDSLPMFFGLVLFNVVHPGHIMPGEDSDMPRRKQRKTMTSYTKASTLDDEMDLQKNNSIV